MACGCDHSRTDVLETCPECEFEPFVRNHFFTGKLMGAADFVAESHFHGEKMRHHNLRLHGSGVVCGLKVHQHPSDSCRTRYVVVEAGSALDCCGHELLVPAPEIIDVGQHPRVRQKTADGALHTLQVAVCYRECPTEEVPVLYDDCGCDDTQCAPNRILESYFFDVLVDPPLADGMGAGAALGAFAVSNTHGATGWIQAGAAGKVAIVDPGSQSQLPGDIGRRVFVLDTVHRSMVIVPLPAKARAIAMSDDGETFFVVTDPIGAAPECQVHVFKTADGSPLPTVAPGTTRIVPGTVAASTVAAMTSSDPNRALLVFNATTGDVHPWKGNAASGIDDAPAAAIVFVKGPGVFAATADGAFLFAVDNAGKVQVRDGATALLGGLPATATPSALTAFTLGATSMLAVASGDENRIYLINRAAGTLSATVNVAHRPVFIGVTGLPAAPWLTIYQEDGSHSYVQSVALEPMVGGGAPLVGAPRAAGSGPPRIVIVHADGQASTVDAARFADSDCADLVCKQVTGCPGCDVPECVVLATIANYRPGMRMLDMPVVANDLGNNIARIDHRGARRTLASTATLQAWLECLQVKGGVPGPKGDPGKDGDKGDPGDPGANGVGTPGKPGVGLEDKLTRIVATSWLHAQPHVPNQSPIVPISFIDSDGAESHYGDGLVIGFSGPVTAPQTSPLFKSLPILEAMLQRLQGMPIPGTYSWDFLRGTITPVTLFTVAGGRITSAVSQAIGGAVQAVGLALLLDKRTIEIVFREMLEFKVPVLVRLRGDFVIDLNGKALDAEFPRATFPSGDGPAGTPFGLQGGLFESWFGLQSEGGAPGSGVPINRADLHELAAVPGIGMRVAEEIVAARAARPQGRFNRMADLRGIAALDATRLRLLKPSITFD